MSRLSKLVLPEKNNYSCRFFLKLYPEIKISARYETQTAKYREDRHRDNISQIPRKLFEGLSADRSTNALHFPDDRTYFSIETFPKSIPSWTPRNIRIDNVRTTLWKRSVARLANREEFQGLRRGRNARRILRWINRQVSTLYAHILSKSRIYSSSRNISRSKLDTSG